MLCRIFLSLGAEVSCMIGCSLRAWHKVVNHSRTGARRVHI